MNDSNNFKRRVERNFDGKSSVWSGIFIVLVGIAALARTYIDGLNWLFSWQMLLIALGVYIGLQKNFRGGSWLILIFIGGYFLIEKYFFVDYSIRKMLWPLALIGLGAYLIFRPRKTFNIFSNDKEKASNIKDLSGTNYSTTTPADSSTINNPSLHGTVEEEILDVVAVFSGVKKNVYSKNFRGGEIVSVFGGAEVNLIQAAFQTPRIEIESVQIFGGAKLIVPSDWVIYNEAVAIFGGIEDKRQQPVALPVPAKILVLKGFVMFGGIEIKSY